MKSRIDELKKTSLKDLASLKDSHKSIIVEIKALRTEVNRIFDKLEKMTVEQLDRMINDLEKGLKNDLDSCANMHDQLKTMMEKLQQITDKHKNISLFIGYKKCKVKLGEANVTVQDIQKRPKQVLRFKSDESLLQFLKNLSSLGNIETVSSLPKRTDGDHVYNAQSSGEYNVRIKEDQNICTISGICELPSGDYVISDSNNKRVKLLNRKYQVIAHCDLSTVPNDLCHTFGNEVAVAVDDCIAKHEVHFLIMSRGKLHAGRRFTTDHQCNCVSHHQGQLYISSNDALHQNTISGILVKRFMKTSLITGKLTRMF
ncbi:uncharacterized protein LOC128223034 [Mya arenaria]|uniref:uncharacterized protein LOC128223034 n=1 Tax=Mya arenaria TaxID=6604 RepID=UPI0022E00FD7|nr:uncharacterized protein LOC128223034 [Mya arenaria]